MNAKQAANIHAKKYIESVFEKRLQEEGFVCPNDKKLCWYRINEHDLANSLIFYSAWDDLPLMLDLGYGIYPLFIKPPYTASVNFPDRPISEAFIDQPLVEDVPINAQRYCPYSPEIQVAAPGHAGKGMFTFDGILLPKFNTVKTIEDCYAQQKQNLLVRNAKNDLGSIFYSDLFIDQAIYLDDTEMYPNFGYTIETRRKSLQKNADAKPDDKKLLSRLQEWEGRSSAIFDGCRKEYLLALDKRKAENIAFCRKRLGLDV